MSARPLDLRVRHGDDPPSIVRRSDWDPARAAVVVCDMWDAHHCVSAERRVAEVAPRMNEVIGALRAQGALVVHAPAGCMSFYRDTPQRLRARSAPRAEPPALIDWNDWEDDERAAMPASLSEPGACSCDTADPCGDAQPPYPWSRQTPSIEIGAGDVVSDDGQELYDMLQHRGIDDVIVMGVHANVCVLGRPYGIRQLVRLGKRPVLCRDLTDAFHRDPRGHTWGTRETVAHVERRWCPTVTSDQLVGGARFRFREGA